MWFSIFGAWLWLLIWLLALINYFCFRLSAPMRHILYRIYTHIENQLLCCGLYQFCNLPPSSGPYLELVALSLTSWFMRFVVVERSEPEKWDSYGCFVATSASCFPCPKSQILRGRSSSKLSGGIPLGVWLFVPLSLFRHRHENHLFGIVHFASVYCASKFYLAVLILNNSKTRWLFQFDLG